MLAAVLIYNLSSMRYTVGEHVLVSLSLPSIYRWTVRQHGLEARLLTLIQVQISGPAQKSQIGSAGPPARHATRQGIPTASHTLQAGGMLTATAFDVSWAGVGVAETSVRAAAATIPKKADFIVGIVIEEEL
jgi:hypothetical protein